MRNEDKIRLINKIEDLYCGKLTDRKRYVLNTMPYKKLLSIIKHKSLKIQKELGKAIELTLTYSDSQGNTLPIIIYSDSRTITEPSLKIDGKESYPVLFGAFAFVIDEELAEQEQEINIISQLAKVHRKIGIMNNVPTLGSASNLYDKNNVYIQRPVVTAFNTSNEELARRIKNVRFDVVNYVYEDNRSKYFLNVDHPTLKFIGEYRADSLIRDNFYALIIEFEDDWDNFKEEISGNIEITYTYGKNVNIINKKQEVSVLIKLVPKG